MSSVPQPSAPSAAARSRLVAIVVALVGLIGMFLALLGWTAVVRDVGSVAGVPSGVVFALGAVIAVGAAVFDLVAGTRSDVYAAVPGQALTRWQFTANKLAPWIIVALTALGVLLIWLRHR